MMLHTWRSRTSSVSLRVFAVLVRSEAMSICRLVGWLRSS